MLRVKLLLSRLNGVALSLLLHGGVALIAGISAFTVHSGGGSGKGSGGMEGGVVTSSFAATLRDGSEELISGEVLPDVAQFGRLTSEDMSLEPITEEPEPPKVSFDIFSVGASQPAPQLPSPSLPEQPTARPGSADDRTVKLPPAAAAGNGHAGLEGDAGNGGSGGGDANGHGKGEGSGTGDAKGVYTPPPAYPTEARRRNIEGSVLVELAIASDGSCALRQIVESSGFGPLDTAVENAVCHWKYNPSDADARTKLIRFTFKLGE